MKVEIVLGQTRDPIELFATEADMDGVDIPASIDRFDEMVLERVREVYPEADISFDEGTRAYVTTESGASDYDAEADVLREIGVIAEDLVNRGDWVVTR